jgi:hypothetical protein
MIATRARRRAAAGTAKIRSGVPATKSRIATRPSSTTALPVSGSTKIKPAGIAASASAPRGAAEARREICSRPASTDATATSVTQRANSLGWNWKPKPGSVSQRREPFTLSPTSGTSTSIATATPQSAGRPAPMLGREAARDERQRESHHESDS